MNAVGSFIDYIQGERRYSPHTVSSYRRDIGFFLDFLGVGEDDFDPEAVSSDDVREWIVSLSAKGMKNNSINRMISSLGSMYRYFRKKGLVEKNPMDRITTLKTPVNLPVYIPESRMEPILKELLQRSVCAAGFKELRDALLVLFLYSTGIRLAELISIDRDDFSGGYSRLRVKGKGDKERMLPVMAPLQEGVLAYIAAINEGNICKSGEKALFLTEKGERISRNEVYRVVREQLTLMGVQGKRSPHVLRHTFATHLLNGGADIREIQELLGHESLQATQVYTHNSITKLKEVYNTAHPRAKKR